MHLIQYFTLFILLGDGEADPGVAGTGGGDGGLGIFNNPLLPLLITGMMLYFLFFLPERRKRKELEAQLGSLKKNDPVITSGGICGVIVNASPGEKYVTIRVDDTSNTKLRVLRSHISHVGSHDETAEKLSDKDKSKDTKDKKDGA